MKASKTHQRSLLIKSKQIVVRWNESENRDSQEFMTDRKTVRPPMTSCPPSVCIEERYTWKSPPATIAIWSKTTWCNKIMHKRETGDTHFVHMSTLHNTPMTSYVLVAMTVGHCSTCISTAIPSSGFSLSVDDNCISDCLSYPNIHEAYCDAIVCVEYKTKQTLFTCNSISLLLPWELTIMFLTERFRHSFEMIR